MSGESEFVKLVSIMKRLRKECPWDRKQTPQSLRQYILEEAYETVEAIDNENWDELRKELGDMLLQIVFQAEIAEEQKLFTLKDIIHSVNEKLVRRHPHVFGNVEVTNEQQVKDNWEQIKLNEEQRSSMLEGIPRNLSGLLRAQRIQEKAAQVGFDWKEMDGVFTKIREETAELEQAIQQKNSEEIETEVGDLFFSLINLARFQKVNAEDALRKTINKFISRFQYIERKLAEKNKSIYHSSLEEMDKLWEESKKFLN
ncbi:MAG: nucleoside triphosphate pyrophosphohydrolase [Caldithrix sp. RBG_13_44_9]|nr:MAG: nucleoside triphosphate pyrophosphohydrolase [Caldithrix sp. RBG_13_44_9]